MEFFLDVSQAATFLRVKVSTIYAWVHQKRLPYRKHGRKLAFCPKELEAWSMANATQPRACGINESSSLKTCRTAEGPDS